jgi:hypothetical protein
LCGRALVDHVRQPTSDCDYAFADPLGMVTFFRHHAQEFVAILRVVHLLRILPKPFDSLHLIDVPLAQDLNHL